MISCLRRAGAEVHEEHVSVWDDLRDGWKAGPGRALLLAAAEARLFTRRPAAFDAFIVGYPGHLDLPAAHRAAGGRPVVFNPLVSLADTLVSDRGRFGPRSLPARLLEQIDRHAFRSADLVVADTHAHARFLAQLTGRADLAVCFVGAEERLFRPDWQPPAPFTALFVGKLIPLQGVETIIAAARLAAELPFRLVGSGQLAPLLRDRPANVEHVVWVEYERLPGELHHAGCALGIFGTTAKAQRVIPNKVFQALACGVPVVTADTPAARELLVDGESALLVPPGDPAQLADAVRRLATDGELARRIAAGGRAAYERGASEAVLGSRWRELIEGLL
ncbi:MAG: glycosyltransferase family 4 protein [Actinobacteria bacterium]|nr:MAG: glycosyltransferase family 4 protein [Actinomycetota bacterium]